MPLANTETTYGPVTRAFHWLIALGILIMVPLGWIAHLAPYGSEDELAAKVALFSAHKTLGVGIFLVAVARILWAVSQPKPVPLHPDRRAETLLAEAVHWLLYGALVMVPLSGWIEHAATDGFAPILWPLGQSLPFVPKSPALAETFATVHVLFQWVLVGAVALHILGALKHAVIDRDGTLSRMAFGTARGTAAKGHPVLTPALLSLAIWAMVLAGGASAGLFANEGPAAPQLEAAQSDWQVTEGTLAIEVQQMGATVAGQFADWTAEIAFEDQDAPGRTGHVTVQIAIPSLTLGSVTKQALGPDFFDATAHPTATFDADLFKVADGYEARGTLGLKGAEIPVTLPFSLHLDGNRAEMEGRTTLDRRSFAIGDSMGDDKQLGFGVQVKIALTAERAPGT